MMHSVIRDLRYALRQLRRSPGFTATAVLTIALGIGATTATFSVVNAALLRALPFEEPNRLAFVWGTFGPEHEIRGASFPEIQDWSAQNRGFTGISAYQETSLNLSHRDRTVARVEAELVSANYFRLVGAEAAVGRTFLPDEDLTPDTHPVAVISHDLWAGRFGSDPDLVGGNLTLNGREYTVVGVMSKGFRGLSFDTEVWIPSMMVSAIRPVEVLTKRQERWLAAVGRLKPSVTPLDAQADLDRVAAQLSESYPEVNTDRGARLGSLHEYYLGPTRSILFIVFGAVGFLLLIAAVNVANLQLVRAAARRREIALRSALGAGRQRIVGQLLTEGMVLAFIGAAGGVLLAYWGISALLPLIPEGVLPGYALVRLDGRVLGFTVLLAGVCGIAFGLVPAFQRSSTDLSHSLKGRVPIRARRGPLGRAGSQQLLVICQVALALVLLIGAALMIRNFRERLSVDPGFAADGLLAMRIGLPENKYAPDAQVRFTSDLVERLHALPTVTSAAVGSDMPLRGNSSAGMLRVENSRDTERIRYYRHRVGTEYFSTLHIPLLSGRAFTRQDGAGGPSVAIASSAMSKRLWPGKGAIGQRVSLGGPEGPWVAIVGVVGDTRFRDLTIDPMNPAEEPDLYLPYMQSPDPDIEVVVRSSGNPANLAALVQREVAELDPGLPIFQVETLTETVARQTASDRFAAFLLGLFSLMALVLASIGIYGVLAYVVRGSRPEIAIRMAIGADAGEVVGIILKQGMILTTAGVAIGLTLALLSTRVLSSLLFGVKAADPMTFLFISLLIGVVALLASYVPARRAARIDPVSALRSE